MASIVKMPKMSDTMTEGLIVSWLKQEGDTVESGEIIAELETDKAVLELDSSDRGVLLKILVEANRTVPLGKPLAIIGERNENINDLLLQIQETTSELSPERLGPALQTAAVSTAIQSETDESAQIRVSPVVRRLADEHRIDLGTVRGSGPGGRIIKRDIETFLENPPDRTQTPPPSEDRFPHNDIPLSPFRLTAIRRLSQSLGPVPHFYLETDVNAEAMLTMKADLRASIKNSRITLTDLLIKACAIALERHPEVNSRLMENAIRQYQTVNIGMAVSVGDDLWVPVIQMCEKKSIAQIAEERSALVQKAQQGTLTLEEMSGGTFTISNLGMFGITRFRAVINPPQAAILAVGCIRDEPIVENGAVVPGKRMALDLSCDHRAFNGTDGARFLDTLKTLLENPQPLASDR